MQIKRFITSGLLSGLFILLLSWGLSVSVPGVQAQPVVAVSIKPLQLIAAAVTDGISSPALLMSERADPHHYSLRPSDRRLLERADVLLWVGPEMERPLARVTGQIGAHVITASTLAGMHLLALEHPDEVDNHLWLDVDNAIVIAMTLADSLSALDADNAPRYRDNARRFASTMATWDEQFRTALAQGPAAQPFAVYHNAYRYLETRYGLSHTMTFTDHEDVSPGLRQLLAIRDRVREGAVQCVLVEPGVNIDRLQQVIADDSLQYVEIDVLARDHTPEASAYQAFMVKVASALMDCIH